MRKTNQYISEVVEGVFHWSWIALDKELYKCRRSTSAVNLTINLFGLSFFHENQSEHNKILNKWKKENSGRSFSNQIVHEPYFERLWKEAWFHDPWENLKNLYTGYNKQQMVKTPRTAPQLQFQEAMRDTEEQEARQRTIAIHSLRPFCINTEGSRGKKCEKPLRVTSQHTLPTKGTIGCNR